MRNSTKELIAEHKKQIALMEMEGSCEFQARRWNEDRWFNASPLEWDFVSWEYRVKPKPIELWVWKYPNGLFGSVTYTKKLSDEMAGESGRVMTLMREVTE